MEAIEYNLPYRWFLDLPVEQAAWTPGCFSMNRQRFIDHATGTAERDQATAMLKHVHKRHKLRPKTVGFDAGYDDGGLLDELEREQKIRPHVPVRKCQIKATDAAGQARRRARRRMKTRGYAISQRIGKRVEQVIGWAKTTGNLSRTRFLGHERIGLESLLTGAAYNLLRMTKLRPMTQRPARPVHRDRPHPGSTRRRLAPPHQATNAELQTTNVESLCLADC